MAVKKKIWEDHAIKIYLILIRTMNDSIGDSCVKTNIFLAYRRPHVFCMGSDWLPQVLPSLVFMTRFRKLGT